MKYHADGQYRLYNIENLKGASKRKERADNGN